MVCVRPGVLLVRARRLRPARALMALDLPTFERPAKATSGGPSGSRSAARAAAARNCACERRLMEGLRILIKSPLSHSGVGQMMRALALIGGLAAVGVGAASAQDLARGEK